MSLKLLEFFCWEKWNAIRYSFSCISTLHFSLQAEIPFCFEAESLVLTGDCLLPLNVPNSTGHL